MIKWHLYLYLKMFSNVFFCHIFAVKIAQLLYSVLSFGFLNKKKQGGEKWGQTSIDEEGG